MIKIYHNPRCSKSRLGVAFLEENKKEFEVINYIKNTITVDELSKIILKLNIKPIELVRTGDKIWKENFRGKDITDVEIIELMVMNPKLIERPIIVNGNKAIIGRPVKEIVKIF